MKNIRIKVAALATGTLLTAPALAQSSPWSVYVGGAYIAFDSSSSFKVNGQPVPGGDATASNNASMAFGAVYHFDPAWSVELALGLPPTSTLTGKGTLSSAGTLGKVEYGPAVVSVRRSFFTVSPVRPYVGIGLNYTLVLNSKDGFVHGLHVKSGFGPVLQIGCEIPIDKNLSILMDLKKIWLSTSGTGTLPAFGGAPAYADVHLNPIVATAAISYRF